VAVLLAFTAVAARAEVPLKVRDGLTSPKPKVRIVAIAAVGKSKDPEARRLLEPLLADEDGAVRAAVVDAIGNLADPSALKSLEKVRDDKDPTVQAVLARVVPALEAMRINLDIGEVIDLTNNAYPGLVTRLQDKTEAALTSELGARASVKRGGVDKGYGLVLTIRYAKQVKDGPNTLLEVKCEMTLIELPGKILRLSSNATAAAGVAGALPKSMEAELARDAVDACAPSLAKDFADYARQRVGR
jgi:hypothetical protein